MKQMGCLLSRVWGAGERMARAESRDPSAERQRRRTSRVAVLL